MNNHDSAELIARRMIDENWNIDEAIAMIEPFLRDAELRGFALAKDGARLVSTIERKDAPNA